MQAQSWNRQSRLEEARSEALCAINAYEKLGAGMDVVACREVLQNIDEKMKTLVAA